MQIFRKAPPYLITRAVGDADGEFRVHVGVEVGVDEGVRPTFTVQSPPARVEPKVKTPSPAPAPLASIPETSIRSPGFAHGTSKAVIVSGVAKGESPAARDRATVVEAAGAHQPEVARFV